MEQTVHVGTCSLFTALPLCSAGVSIQSLLIEMSALDYLAVNSLFLPRQRHQQDILLCSWLYHV